MWRLRALCGGYGGAVGVHARRASCMLEGFQRNCSKTRHQSCANASCEVCAGESRSCQRWERAVLTRLVSAGRDQGGAQSPCVKCEGCYIDRMARQCKEICSVLVAPANDRRICLLWCRKVHSIRCKCLLVASPIHCVWHCMRLYGPTGLTSWQVMCSTVKGVTTQYDARPHKLEGIFISRQEQFPLTLSNLVATAFPDPSKGAVVATPRSSRDLCSHDLVSRDHCINCSPVCTV